jgi:hypothetical protein
MEMNIDTKKFDEDGYLIVKSAFTTSEINTMREQCYKQFEIDRKMGLTYSLDGLEAKFVKGDLLSKELLYPVLLDNRILSLARTILANQNLIYFGDSSYQIGTGSNGFHRDNIDRSNLDGPDWKGKYTLVRIGLYLQDHKNYSGGLKVRRGSHKKAGGEVRFVENEAGDLVIWDLKTIHSGNAVRLKSAPDLSINAAVIERNIPRFLRKEEQQERISLFMTYALESSHLDRYLNEYTLKRKDTIEHAELSKYSDDAIKHAASKGVKVVRPLELKHA